VAAPTPRVVNPVVIPAEILEALGSIGLGFHQAKLVLRILLHGSVGKEALLRSRSMNFKHGVPSLGRLIKRNIVLQIDEAVSINPDTKSWSQKFC
jgi:hypothetical protein